MFRKLIHIIPAVLVVVALSLPVSAEAGSKQHRNVRGRPVAQYIQAGNRSIQTSMKCTSSVSCTTACKSCCTAKQNSAR